MSILLKGTINKKAGPKSITGVWLFTAKARGVYVAKRDFHEDEVEMID